MNRDTDSGGQQAQRPGAAVSLSTGGHKNRENLIAPRTPHRALAPTPRNIRTASGWLWQEKQALRVIGDAFTGDRLRAARSIYLALTEIASNQFTPARAHTSCAYLGSLAGCSESSARRYLKEFVRLGLVAIEPGVHQANTFVLQGFTIPADGLAEAEMALADSAGKSRSLAAAGGMQGGIALTGLHPSDHTPPPACAFAPQATAGGPAYQQTSPPAPPALFPARHSAAGWDLNAVSPAASVRRGGAVRGDTPRGAAAGKRAAGRAVTSGSQDLRIPDSRIQNQQPDGVGDAVAGAANVQPKSAASEPPGVRPPSAARESTLSDEQADAARALTSIGVRRQVAKEMAAACPPATVWGWVRYARQAAGLKSRAGFVLAMLKQGEEPPAPYPRYQPVGYGASPTVAPVASLTLTHDPKPPLLAAQPDRDAGEQSLTKVAPSEPPHDIALQQQSTGSPSSGQQPPPRGLTAASLREDAGPTTTLEAPTLTPNAHALALWQAVREELRGLLPASAWNLWLQHVRLVASDAAKVQLSHPKVGVAENFERRYGAAVRDVLDKALGRSVAVEFVRSWLALLTTCYAALANCAKLNAEQSRTYTN